MTLSCSPTHTVSNISYRFNPPPKKSYGEEDVKQWLLEVDLSNFCNSEHPCNTRQDSLFNMYLPGFAESFWKPSEDDLKPLNRKLKRALRKNRWNNLKNRPGTYWEYSFAYLGVVYNQEKFIEISALRCDITERCVELQYKSLIGFGYGKNFFSTSYNVENKELSDFSFGTHH